MDGAALRDDGIARVMTTEEEWAEDAGVAFNFWLNNIAPVEFTIEEFRMYVEAHDMPEPHHPNVWGGMAKRFADRIQHVGYTTSIRPKAHARLTRTYRRA